MCAVLRPQLPACLGGAGGRREEAAAGGGGRCPLCGRRRPRWLAGCCTLQLIVVVARPTGRPNAAMGSASQSCRAGSLAAAGVATRLHSTFELRKPAAFFKLFVSNSRLILMLAPKTEMAVSKSRSL